jgi:BirA family transcriptional regulator, biotin operon repressor / biotin---[acetyl-CoA-carboxylase] ligase
MSLKNIGNELRHVLPQGCLGMPVHFYETIDSTMTEAGRLAESGAPAGTMVLAEMQTKGRGRLGRQWVSESSSGLFFTLILRPQLSPAASPVLTLMAGVSLATVVAALIQGSIDLRWPNDLLINEKKCAGILIEMRAEPHRILHVLLGIGINVNQTAFPQGLETPPSSLMLEGGRPIQRADFLISLLKQLNADYNFLLTNGAAQALARFESISSYARGKRVRIGEGPEVFTGTTAGLTSEGILLICRDDSGTTEGVVAGHVRPI